MKIDIISLFPEFFAAFFNHSIIKRAMAANRLTMAVTNPRDFAHNKHGQVDDTPYGGGAGMLMMAPPIFEAVEHVLHNTALTVEDSSQEGIVDNVDTIDTVDMADTSLVANRLSQEPVSELRKRVIFLGPTGTTFNQAKARELATYDQLVLICGHYEGVDYRVEEHLVDETISIGDFVLTGGELPAMIVADAVARMIPGVLGAASGAIEDSFYRPILEGPQYTKPPVYRDWAVPEVLRSGHHQNIANWRLQQALLRTLQLRPDLLERELTGEEERAIKELKKQGLWNP
ncbi:tRNA (guanosine(37)-N1)-methyltransferase TrmD [Veillonella intestinalis]|uniref:tRNA (guanosine(37)-N1)-methyltransferase TrmD n=1 Tax=Veillonella intestinalis TaxID=2941341 RepID=UPI00203B7034|nr:tRNA (guanosine(37)-N1)-methyltransferase TrmD [Veillonella intestinalis]